MSPDRLSRTALAALPADVARPAYDIGEVTPGIVHLASALPSRPSDGDDGGRAASGDLAWASSRRACATRTRATRWGPRDGLYTVSAKGSDGESLAVIGAVRDLIVAPENPEG